MLNVCGIYFCLHRTSEIEILIDVEICVQSMDSGER